LPIAAAGVAVAMAGPAHADLRLETTCFTTC